MLNNVQYDRGIFTATDETGRQVTIDESISFIFQVEVKKGPRVRYTALNYKAADVLEQIENYFTGEIYSKKVLESIVVRYGWMDKNLNKLTFLPLLDLVKMVNGKEATLTDKRKLNAVLKQLCISKKRVTVI